MSKLHVNGQKNLLQKYYSVVWVKSAVTSVSVSVSVYYVAVRFFTATFFACFIIALFFRNRSKVFPLALITFSRNLSNIFFFQCFLGSMFFFLYVFFLPFLIRFWIFSDPKQRN